MQVEILTPDEVIFNGDASALTLPGIDGRFQVLSNHAPLIAALGQGTIIIEAKSGNEDLTIKNGFVEVLNNNVSVLVEKA